MRFRGPGTAFLNRAADGSFKLPEDGWYHLVPKGRFPIMDPENPRTVVTQVVDEQALTAMMNRFEREAQGANFPGVLIDYDHFSYDTDKPSAAAGWVTRMENRGNGIWGQVKWTNRALEAIREGEYRFISPVWDKAESTKLKNSEYRPVRLERLGLTNDPNLKGMVPLQNRQQAEKDEKEQSQMKNINTELGLSPDAAEEAAVAEIRKLKNRSASVETLTTENETLKEENGQLLEAQVESDLAKFANRIKPEAKDKWKKRLLKNRAETLEILEEIEEPEETGAAAGAGAGAGGQKMLNRKDGRAPQGDDKASQTELVRATKIKNRAQQLAREEGLGFSQAWKQAEGEMPA